MNWQLERNSGFIGGLLLKEMLVDSQIGDRMLAVISCPNTSYVFKDCWRGISCMRKDSIFLDVRRLDKIRN